MAGRTNHECRYRIVSHPDDPDDKRVLTGCRCGKTKIEKKPSDDLPDLCHDETVR